LIYLLVLFGALGFIPLLRPGPLLVAIPIVAISLLSRLPNYYGIGHHYTAGLLAPMIFAFIGGLPRARKISEKMRLPSKWFVPMLITGLLAVHIALAPSPIGRLFWSSKIWSYHFEAYLPTARSAMIKNAIRENIPLGSAAIAVQNTLNWAPLAERYDYFVFPEGVTNHVIRPTELSGTSWPLVVEWRPILADYVLLDSKRPWFLFDQGCEWVYGKCSNQAAATEYLEWVTRVRQLMEVIFEEDGFVILHRRQVSK
jgi:uncharacterized membrane protein